MFHFIAAISDFNQRPDVSIQYFTSLMPCNLMTDKTGTVGDRRIWIKKCIKLTLKVIEDPSLPFNVPFH